MPVYDVKMKFEADGVSWIKPEAGKVYHLKVRGRPCARQDQPRWRVSLCAPARASVCVCVALPWHLAWNQRSVVLHVAPVLALRPRSPLYTHRRGTAHCAGQIRCANCGEESGKFSTLTTEEEVEVPGGRGTAHLVQKCKMCVGRPGSGARRGKWSCALGGGDA